MQFFPRPFWSRPKVQCGTRSEWKKISFFWMRRIYIPDRLVFLGREKELEKYQEGKIGKRRTKNQRENRARRNGQIFRSTLDVGRSCSAPFGVSPLSLSPSLHQPFHHLSRISAWTLPPPFPSRELWAYGLHPRIISRPHSRSQFIARVEVELIYPKPSPWNNTRKKYKSLKMPVRQVLSPPFKACQEIWMRK